MADLDLTGQIQEQVQQALEDLTPMCITAGNSKVFYGRAQLGECLDVSGHQGIVNYQPTELVVTVRAGTLLRDLENVLAEQGQMLPFEPPYFTPQATIGGTVACAMSGSRRPFTGAVRDFVLGCKIINGRGEVLSFGGEVMKNVAGFDVSRLMTGAFGTLGVILQVSLKVLPKPQHEATGLLQLDEADAINTMTSQCRGKLPISALSYHDGQLMVRFSGIQAAVERALQESNCRQIDYAPSYWQSLGEQEFDFFRKPGDLWRLSLPAATPALDLSGSVFYDWGGALRWLKSTAEPHTIFNKLAAVDGHATLFRSMQKHGDVFQPLPTPMQALHRRIKKAFDPQLLFNRQRMYEDW